MSQDDSFKTATEDPTPASEHLRLGDKRPADDAVPTAARHGRPSRLPRLMGNSGPLPADAAANSASPYAAPAAALAALTSTDAETAAALRRIAQGGAPVTANLGTQGAHSFQLAGAHTKVSISHHGPAPAPSEEAQVADAADAVHQDLLRRYEQAVSSRRGLDQLLTQKDKKIKALELDNKNLKKALKTMVNIGVKSLESGDEKSDSSK
ncbi:hypothetical protein OC834_007376 [Tilletia horrida]|nr:hypothetical protein OC834_007376 [Tilletia horrida]KAK0551111.1 hypothetical protein OC844_006626 [Tilletia horrida]